MTSNARLPLERWTHVGVVRKKGEMRLYVNGILDALQKFNGTTTPNSHPIFIGAVPWHKEECQVPMYMDEVRLFSGVVQEALLEAEASPALGGVEPSFV